MNFAVKAKPIFSIFDRLVVFVHLGFCEKESSPELFWRSLCFLLCESIGSFSKITERRKRNDSPTQHSRERERERERERKRERERDVTSA